ncbi:hypothetical protein Vadar_031697 [Vaccinium darrowii]|uniref:Uncharacterized protein n=1 Tax=Vaccinium darrowii TaxID=229202 RepID=A0ACB7XM16_9ERIC|nr:hypothetical protein Vadar_031697 [Vaccinium darrowii]
MKLMAWNSQGLGGALTANQLKELCQLHSPQLIFLSETKNQLCRIDFIRRFVGMDFCLVVDPIGIAGGLAVLWKRSINVCLIRSCSFFIEVEIKDDESGYAWRLINLYASSIDSVRKLQWDELVRYRQQSSAEWMIWGDFNDLLDVDEKQGGRRRETWSLKVFRDFVTNLGVVDLGFTSYSFTWVNRRRGNRQIKERLDRALVSPGWRLHYDKSKLQHLFAVGSDHMVLLLDTNPPKFTGQRQFRFDNRWTSDAECKEVIRKSWQVGMRGSKMFDVFHRIRNTRSKLRIWSKARNFNARRKINEVQNQLKEIGDERVYGDMEQIWALEKDLGDAWVQEEKCWRQKARISWMIEGDRNTSFFHVKVTQRRKRNTISGIQDLRGNWCENQEDIAKEFVMYFEDLFKSDGTNHICKVIDSIKAQPSVGDNVINSGSSHSYSYGGFAEFRLWPW